jgi:protein-tyrosine phosphatase
MLLCRVYVHCTAGLGRAPGTIIAYLYWFQGLQLHAAYDYLTSIRPCGPKKDAVRGATHDLMSGRSMEAFNHEPHHAWTHLNEHQQAEIQSKVLRS